MIVFPPCKINLNLTVLQKRADGYHDLASVFYPFNSVRDALEMLPDEKTSLIVTGTEVAGDPSANLCLRAYELLRADFAAIQPVRIHLHKSIPIGAGLGGGSSDGSWSLRLLNQLFSLNLSMTQLLPYASALGSDCSFFLYDVPCTVRGKGDILTPMEPVVDLSLYQIILVNPGIHISSAWAFAQLDESDRHPAVDLPGDVREWKGQLTNDLEEPVFRKYPEVGHLKEALYAQGAIYAAMTGSGSTVFGLFHRGHSPTFSFPPSYWTHSSAP